MSDWTKEQYDALPEGTVLDVYREDWECWESLVSEGDGEWIQVGEPFSYTSEELIGKKTKIFSVPVDALLSDEVALVVANELKHKYRTASRMAMRAAIAHVTGEKL